MALFSALVNLENLRVFQHVKIQLTNESLLLSVHFEQMQTIARNSVLIGSSQDTGAANVNLNNKSGGTGLITSVGMNVNDILVDNRLSIFPSVKNILKKVKEKEIDLLIDLQNSTRTELYNLFIKIFTKCKILSARKFSDFKYRQKKLGFQHITKNHQEQLKYLEIKSFFSSVIISNCGKNKLIFLIR